MHHRLLILRSIIAHPDIVADLQRLAEAAREELGDAIAGRTGKGVRQPGRVIV